MPNITPWPTLEQEWPAAKADAQGWPAFRERVILQFYPLLWKEGWRWYHRHRTSKLGTIDDCAAEASIALLNAIDHFDPSRGIKFITYAVRSIRLTLSRRSDEMNLIRIPANVATAMRTGRPTETRHLHADAERAKCLQSISDWAWNAIPGRDHADYPKEECEMARRAMEFLDPRSKEVITRRFLKGETLAETGESLGISKERARQLQVMALRKLRRLLSNCVESSE